MCDTPHYVEVKGMFDKIPVACGKCPSCKIRRVNSWVFRLQEEDKVSSSAYFITLTYDTYHVPITNSGFMTLSKRDFQLFMKRLRKLSDNKLRYYAVGEYGTINWRPHYHVILFNLEGVKRLPDGSYKSDFIEQAWRKVSDLDDFSSPIGQVHIGMVTSDSIAYTCKYIDKPARVPVHGRDDRVPEFSLMSKGLGKSFITPAIEKFFKSDLSRCYVIKEGGYKIALPKYFRDKLLTETERGIAISLIAEAVAAADRRERAEFLAKNPGQDFDVNQRIKKNARYNRFYSKSNKIRKL